MTSGKSLGLQSVSGLGIECHGDAALAKLQKVNKGSCCPLHGQVGMPSLLSTEVTTSNSAAQGRLSSLSNECTF